MPLDHSTMTRETLALVNDALNAPLAKSSTFMQPSTATTGLQDYDLEPAIRNFRPVLTPWRGRIPRTNGRGSQANWKAVTNFDSTMQYGGIQEGRRGGQIDQSSQDYYAKYATIGLENSVTFEAQNAGQGFDDLRARAVMQLVSATMELEEKIILGGNSMNALGTTPTPTCTSATTGGSISNGVVVSVICMALTYDGWRRNSASTTGVVQTATRTNMDGTTTAIAGGTAAPSASATVTTGAGSTNAVTAKVAPVRGAFGYAWYAGVAGSEKFAGITVTSQTVLTAVPAGGSLQTAASLVATDYSRDTLIHDGLLGFCGNASLGSYYNAVAPGSTLTPDGGGGIYEFDTALRYFWDNLRLVPSRIVVASQEAMTLKRIIMNSGAATSLARFNFAMQPGQIVAGGSMPVAYNTIFGNQQAVAIEQHPFMVPGTVLFITDDLPYPLNNVTNMMEVQCRQDYWQTEWPLVTRSYQFGVYTDQVLKHYFPPSMGMITNLAPA